MQAAYVKAAKDHPRPNSGKLIRAALKIAKICLPSGDTQWLQLLPEASLTGEGNFGGEADIVRTAVNSRDNNLPALARELSAPPKRVGTPTTTQASARSGRHGDGEGQSGILKRNEGEAATAKPTNESKRLGGERGVEEVAKDNPTGGGPQSGNNNADEQNEVTPTKEPRTQGHRKLDKPTKNMTEDNNTGSEAGDRGEEGEAEGEGEGEGDEENVEGEEGEEANGTENDEDEDNLEDMVKIKQEAVEYHRMHTDTEHDHGSGEGGSEDELDDERYNREELDSGMVIDKELPVAVTGPSMIPMPSKPSSTKIPGKRKRSTEDPEHQAPKRSKVGPPAHLPPALDGPCDRCLKANEQCETDWESRVACNYCAKLKSRCSLAGDREDSLAMLAGKKPKKRQPKADRGTRLESNATSEKRQDGPLTNQASSKKGSRGSSKKRAKTAPAVRSKQVLPAPARPVDKRSLSAALASNASDNDENSDGAPAVTGTGKPPQSGRMILKAMPPRRPSKLLSEKAKGKQPQKSVTPGSEFETRE